MLRLLASQIAFQGIIVIIVSTDLTPEQIGSAHQYVFVVFPFSQVNKKAESSVSSIFVCSLSASDKLD